MWARCQPCQQRALQANRNTEDRALPQRQEGVSQVVQQPEEKNPDGFSEFWSKLCCGTEEAAEGSSSQGGQFVLLMNSEISWFDCTERSRWGQSRRCECTWSSSHRKHPVPVRADTQRSYQRCGRTHTYTHSHTPVTSSLHSFSASCCYILSLIRRH